MNIKTALLGATVAGMTLLAGAVSASATEAYCVVPGSSTFSVVGTIAA
jgi:outer membrane murein-binding lipoprotein Lpp